jgi:ATP phosphoribosyltransferase regulatory subunit
LIRFVDQDGRLVALRADFTSSIARIAATKLADVPVPLRLSYAGKVYRQTLEGGGHRREVFQLGAELIGDASAEADVEIIRLALSTLQALGIEDFQLNLGEIRFIQPLLRGMEEGLAEDARTAIDRRDRAALADVVRRGNLEPAVAEVFRSLPSLIGRGDMLDRANALTVHDDSRRALNRLKEIDALLTAEEREKLVYDLGEIQGLGYYSGMRFEVFVAGVGRAVGSGGRYDHLLDLYGVDRPAVGFALETDVLAELLATRAPR